MQFSFLRGGLLGAGLLLMASATEAATPVNCGDVLSAPGEYYLAGDLECSIVGGPAVQISADNVHFNLRGHRITEISGNNAGILVGVDCSSDAIPLSNVQISNGIVDGFDWGIYACSTTDLRIAHMQLINSITALELVWVSGGDINASTFTAKDGAVVVRRSHDNRFHGNRLGGADIDADGGCHWGYLFNDGSYNVVTGNEIAGCNGDAGVAFRNLSSGNIVRGNLITGSASYGVIAQASANGNIIQANRVTGFGEDLKDLSGSCVNNTWKANQFTTATPTCLK